MMSTGSKAFTDQLEAWRNPTSTWFVNLPRRIEICSFPARGREVTPEGQERR